MYPNLAASPISWFKQNGSQSLRALPLIPDPHTPMSCYPNILMLPVIHFPVSMGCYNLMTLKSPFMPPPTWPAYLGCEVSVEHPFGMQVPQATGDVQSQAEPDRPG